MRHISIVVPLLLAFSSEGYGGALRKLFCPTICNPNPKEPLSTCFYKCGFLKYGKYFDGSRCWYFVGTGKIINSKGYCNQGICLKVFTTGYEGSPAQRNCEVHQAKVPSKGETGVKGTKFNVTQASEHGPSEIHTKNATMEWHRFSLEPITPARTPNIPHTKGGLTEAHGGVTATLDTNTAAPPAGLTTASPLAELTTIAVPAGFTMAAQPTGPTTAPPPTEMTTAVPPAGITLPALPTQLSTAAPSAELTTVKRLAELTTATPSPELMTVVPPTGVKVVAPPAEQTTVAPPAGFTIATQFAGSATAPPPTELTKAAPPAGITTAAPPAELTTIAAPAGFTMAPRRTGPTTALPPTEVTTTAPPAGITSAALPTLLSMVIPSAELSTAAPSADLTTVEPLEKLTTAAPSPELMTVVPPTGVKVVAPPAERTTVALPAGFTIAAQFAGSTTAPPPAEQTKTAPLAGITTAAPLAQLPTALAAAGRTTAAPLAEITTIAAPAGFTMAAQPAEPTTAPPPTELTTATQPAGITTAPPPAKLVTAAPPAGLMEAQASTHDQRNVSHSVQETATTSTNREHIAKATKEGVSLSTLSQELPLATEESTVPPEAPGTTVLSLGTTHRHEKGRSPKEAEISTATSIEMPVNTEQSPTTVSPALTSTPATEHGPSKNYTTNATTEWPVLSLEQVAPATPPNIPSTKADLSEAHEVVTVTLGTSTAAPPARGMEVQASTHDQKNGPYSVQGTAVTSTSKEHINTTAKEGTPLSTSSPELALTTGETTVPTTTTSTTLLSPGSTDKHLKGTSANVAPTSTETTSEPPVNTGQPSTTVLSPVTHAPEAESHSPPRRPAPLEDNLFEDNMATIYSHISSAGTETTKASDKVDMTTPISVTVVPDIKELSENTSGKFTEEKLATIAEALSDAGRKWSRTVSAERSHHEQAAPQAATTPESHANRGASGGTVSQGAPSAPTSAPIKKSETQPAAEKIINMTVSAILPQATTPSHVAQNVSKSAPDSPVPIYSMLIASVIIIANYYCF